MPRFFFDYRDGQGRLDRDDEGVEFPSLVAAYEDATQAAVDMSMDACCSGHCATQDAFEIRDEVWPSAGCVAVCRSVVSCTLTMV